MKKPGDVLQPRWSVYLLKRKAQRLPFSVQARDAEEALERGIKETACPSASGGGSA
jgi:hypothetical protein